jgi:hypothetical protein
MPPSRGHVGKRVDESGRHKDIVCIIWRDDIQIRELFPRRVMIAKCLEDTYDSGKMSPDHFIHINHKHKLHKSSRVL